MKNTIVTIREKKALLEILETMLDRLEQDRDYVSKEYTAIGVTDEQDTDWRTGELKFDEDGNPVYKKEYGYVDKTELDEHDKAKLNAYNYLIDELNKMV